MKTRGKDRDRIYEALLLLAEPETILDVALDEYHRYGNEEHLAMAASLLADIGARALPALWALVRSGRPECEMFVPVIAHLRGVSVQSRLALLAQVASNPSTDVRYGLLEALRAFSPHHVIPLLRTLSHDGDTEIADEARAWLESLEAAATSISPAAGFEMDIEEPDVFRMPIPETKWLSAIVVNLGPAKPRLVLNRTTQHWYTRLDECPGCHAEPQAKHLGPRRDPSLRSGDMTGMPILCGLI
jgi:hypothetical protein